MKQIFDERKALAEIVNSITVEDERNCFIAVEYLPKNQRESLKAEGHFVPPEGFTNTALGFNLETYKDRWENFEVAKAELESDGYKVFESKDLKKALVMLFKYRFPIYDCMADKPEWLETYDKYYFEWADYRDMFLSDEEKESRASVFSDIATGLETVVQ